MFELLRSTGKKHYDACGHREVALRAVENPSDNGRTVYIGRLTCPNPVANGLETDGVKADVSDTYRPKAAREDLRRIAAREACGNCALSGLTSTELFNRQAEQARAEIASLDAQKQLAEARKAHQLLMEQVAKEVDGINADTLGSDAQPVQVIPPFEQ